MKEFLRKYWIAILAWLIMMVIIWLTAWGDIQAKTVVSIIFSAVVIFASGNATFGGDFRGEV